MKRKPVSGIEQQKLKEENAFLKMKLMLENGAQINGTTGELPPEVENQFLKYVMAFEKQVENPTMIRIFDKIGKPTQFKPAAELQDAEIEQALSDIRGLLHQHGIDLTALSPHVSGRELYRFILEEFLQQEIIDIKMPSMIQGFIYDEFHPDPEFENQQIAIDNCLKEILSEKPLEDMSVYRQEELQLNEHFPLSHEDFKRKIQLFKDSYRSIENLSITDVLCRVEEKYSFVRGAYSFVARWESGEISFKGKWLINFEKADDDNNWDIFSVQIEGVNF